MRYLVIDWIHNLEHEPYRIYTEIDKERYEVRKMELFKNGKIGYADMEIEFGGSVLGEVPYPEDELILTDPEFHLKEISKEEFEEIWKQNIKKR